jgi:hypothetical protein
MSASRSNAAPIKPSPTAQGGVARPLRTAADYFRKTVGFCPLRISVSPKPGEEPRPQLPKHRAVKTALPDLQTRLPDVFKCFRRSVEDGTGACDCLFVGALRIAGTMKARPFVTTKVKHVKEQEFGPWEVAAGYPRE